MGLSKERPCALVVNLVWFSTECTSLYTYMCQIFKIFNKHKLDVLTMEVMELKAEIHNYMFLCTL